MNFDQHPSNLKDNYYLFLVQEIYLFIFLSISLWTKNFTTIEVINIVIGA